MEEKNQPRRPRRAPEEQTRNESLVYGKNPVTELLKSGSGVDTVLISESMAPAVAAYYTALAKCPAGTRRFCLSSIWPQHLPQRTRCSGCKGRCAPALPPCAPKYKAPPAVSTKTAGIFLTLCARALCTKTGGYGIIENNV